VVVVDDNAGFRESIAALLDTERMVVVGEAGTGEEAIGVVGSVLPDVVLMDVRMPDMDGIETTRLLKDRFPDVGVVALSGFDDQEAVRDMLVAGAAGYVLKDSDGDEILQAISEAATGRGHLSPGVTPSVIEELTEALERERRRTRQLEVAQAALLERSARRHELVSRLGHELRTPVTVILGIAQTLSSDSASPEQSAQMLDRLVERTTDLARLVQRFEAAVEAGLTEWADVSAVAREVAEQRPRVRVEAPSTPAMASMNRVAARRILEELVENALAFSPDGEEVLVRVSLAGTGPEVRVVDRGPGIDAENVERIFGPLEQGEDLYTRTHQGAGLGLALARTSARAMDGDVLLESTGPEGSTFLWVVSRSV
jgi:signal transduction histidine kinase